MRAAYGRLRSPEAGEQRVGSRPVVVLETRGGRTITQSVFEFVGEMRNRRRLSPWQRLLELLGR